MHENSQVSQSIKINDQAAWDAEKKAERYYNSVSADVFYERVWGGGTDIHVGLYETADEPIGAASRRTVKILAERLRPLVPSIARGIDLGAGYGGSARYLASSFGFEMTCLNIAARQNQKNQEAIDREGLRDKVTIRNASFQDIPFESETFDFAWSLDAMDHSPDKCRLLDEVDRILRPGGVFIFTDLMQKPNAPTDKMAPILARIELDSMGSFEFYEQQAKARGWSTITQEDYSSQAAIHYERARGELLRRNAELVHACGKAYVDGQIHGLGHWIQGFKQQFLTWGVLIFRKPTAR